jgi:hypothetical protein
MKDEEKDDAYFIDPDYNHSMPQTHLALSIGPICNHSHFLYKCNDLGILQNHQVSSEAEFYDHVYAPLQSFQFAPHRNKRLDYLDERLSSKRDDGTILIFCFSFLALIIINIIVIIIVINNG